jgi:hypothetical protein
LGGAEGATDLLGVVFGGSACRKFREVIDKGSFSMYMFHYSFLILKYFGCVGQVN